MTVRVLGVLCGLLLLPGMLNGTACAKDDPRVEYRQVLMKTIADNMKAITTIFKARLENHQNIIAHAQQIKVSAGLIEGAFQEEVLSPTSESKPEIWSEWSDYVAIINELETEATKLAAIQNTGYLKEVGVALKAVGKTCAACHQLYRQKKD